MQTTCTIRKYVSEISRIVIFQYDSKQKSNQLADKVCFSSVLI